MKSISRSWFLVFTLGQVLGNVQASDEVFNLKGLKFKAGFLKDPKSNCKVEEEKIACYYKDSGSMFVVSIVPKESDDDVSLYAKVLKNKKINLPLVSKPMANESFFHDKRKWVYSLHSNAEVPEHLTAYYLTAINQHVFLLSFTTKDDKAISTFKTTTFKQLSVQ